MRALVLLAVPVMVLAQDPRFGVQSRLVLVPVTVTDAKGHAIDGLGAKDFVVLDNGRPQRVTVDTVATGVPPIALMVAIQASGISKVVLEKVHMIGTMIQPVVTGERGCAAVLSFSERITWLQECTNDEEALKHAFEQVRPGAAKSARMLDAVHEAVTRLGKYPNARRVLLLISESRDRGSEAALDRVLVDAQAAGVTVYAATYSAFKTAFTSKSSATGEPQVPKRQKRPSEETGTISGVPPNCGPRWCPDPQLPTPEQRVDIRGGLEELLRLGKTNSTQALTKSTGGTTFPFTRLKGLENAILQLGTELEYQYLVSFTPSDFTSGYHSLELRVSDGNFRIRARPGYWSTQPTQ